LSNAVNLTDGLDGLAGGSTYFTLVIFSLLLMTQQGHTETYPSLLLLLLALPCLLAFLPHNRYPARIFMGDSGSLALGGFIASIGLMTHQDGWLLLSAGLFTIEALSVALQVLSFKYLGKRIFKMAPLHHHFELCGWNEQTVVQVFLSVHLLLCLLAFALERLV
jgi:phospho-N-acetylmuramoyl-pentapeptide-transferase